MSDFLQKNLVPIIIALDTGRYPLPLIQKRWHSLTGKIKQNYGVPLSLQVITGQRSPMDRGTNVVCFDSGLKEKMPFARIFAPTLIQMFEKFRKEYPSNYPGVFETYVVISLMHEGDHLAHDLVNPTGKTRQDLIDYDRQAWALTCEHTIDPLVDIYHKPISAQDSLFYQAWIRANRDVDNPSWHAFINERYANAYH